MDHRMCNASFAMTMGFSSTMFLFTMGYFVYNTYFKKIDKRQGLMVLMSLFVLSSILSYYELCNMVCQDWTSSFKYALLLTVLVLIFMKFIIKKFDSDTPKLVGFVVVNSLTLTVLHKALCHFRFY